MSEPLLIAIVGIIGAALGAVIAQIAPWKRGPSEERLAEAKADREQHEAGSLVILNLIAEVARMKDEIRELKSEITKLKILAENANEYRRANHILGDKLDKERAKHPKFMAIIENLLDFAEGKTAAGPIDRISITRLIQAILDGV